MKNVTLFVALFSFMLFSFNTDNIKKTETTNELGNCNQTYVINGGANCPYNGATTGWCSEAEFNEYADNVYSLEECCGNGYTPKQ